MTYLPLMAVAATYLAGCSSWPEIPSHQYTGTVINGMTSLPVEGATIEAFRNKVRGFVFIMPYESLGTTKSDTNGRFLLQNREGWAKWLRAEAPGPYFGTIQLDSKSSDEIVIELAPGIHTITSRLYIDNSEDLTNPIRDMVERIVNFHDANTTIPYLSLNEYLDQGIVLNTHIAILEANPLLFTYPSTKGFSNKIFIAWGDRLFVYRNLSTPVSFSHYDLSFFDPN